jgi:thioredoxin 1
MSVDVVSENQWNDLFPVTKGTRVLVKFSAVYCAPCKAIKPRYEMHAQNNPNIKFLNVPSADVLKNLSAAFKVTAYPTFLAFADGKEIGRFVGADPASLLNLVQFTSTFASE